MDIVIGNNQNRVKDSYASAPVIDLTLRSNGEEPVMVMDSLGQFVPAGLPPPSVSPSMTLGTGSGFTPNLWVAYRYVYAATERYPYIENAVTAGGNLSPRSNPSPSASYQIDATGKGAIVRVTNSSRVDITRIWIYRTAYYNTSAEAITAADAGLLNYVGAVVNNAIPGTVTYSDTTAIVSGNEQIEVDNFEAPQFALCLYDPPYFYGFGNQEFVAEITVTAAGLVTLTDAADKWFNGRNGQVVTMDDITSGGFDNYGGYYFKWLSNTTAQLCLDIALTLNGPVSASGTTTIHIKGPSTTLYRSKPNNPLSWGEITVVGSVNVPKLYAQRVGGGNGTAMAIVPILNLLKLDTEGPNKTYVYNLNGKGTPSFEVSKREISSGFSTSNHWSQFEAKSADGNSYLWFFDYKFNAICQADGAVNTEVSSPVFELLRNLSTSEEDRKFSHGVYDPSLQISCVWLTTLGSTVKNNLMIGFHHPTNQWFTVDQKDILCSLSFLDRNANKQITLIGTETGRIGISFAKDYFWEWLKPATTDSLPAQSSGFTLTTITTSDFAFGDNSMVGVWVYIKMDYIGAGDSALKQADKKIVGCARISIYDPVVPGFAATITFDKFVNWNGVEVTDFSFMLPSPSEYNVAKVAFTLYPGMIFCNGCKFFPTPNFVPVKVTQIMATADNISPNGSDNFRLLLQPEYQNPFVTVGLQLAPFEETLETLVRGDRYFNILQYPNIFNQQGVSNIWYAINPFKIDKTNGFRVRLENLGYAKFLLYNYSVTYDL